MKILNLRRWFRPVILSLMFVLLGLLLRPAPTNASIPEDFDQNRARLLSYVLRHQTEAHFSGKEINNELSRAAFHLYLKQLDYQKRLLLFAEVDQLKIFEERIDDEILTGRVILAPFTFRLLENSIARAERAVTKILERPFDFSVDEDYETDPEKLEFCKTEELLVERWRLDLKYRTLNRYLNLLKDADLDDPLTVEPEKQAEVELEAREKMLKQYTEYFNRLKKETLKDHYDRYLNAFSRAFDPHTTYMPPQSKEDFDISMRGSLEGIGATLREEDGYIKIVKIIPGSASDRQGQLHADDVILAVAQGKDEPVDITDMRLRDAVSLIRGKKGTEVRLTIRREGHTPFAIPIVRDVVIIEESFVKSALVTDPASGKEFGYIKVPSFYRDFELTRNGGKGRNSTDDVRAALKDLGKAEINGLILDLRNNGGGALTDAVGITGLFVGKGPVVQVRSGQDKDPKVLYNYDPEIAYHGPLVVLVNHFSASASEIVAGALQDYGRAVIVGSAHTHGKGTVQVVMDLDKTLTLRNMRQYMPLGALKVTTQKFYRVSGDSTQYRGVEPDIVLPDRSQNNKFGERHLDYSLPWDTISAVEHESWDNLPGYESLNINSQARVAENEDFIEIQRVADVLGERIKNTRQSLRLDKVVQEREDFKGMDSPHDKDSMADSEEPKSGEKAEDSDAEVEEKSDQEKLIEAVLKDAYTLESMSILSDLLAHEAEVVKQ